MPARHTQTDRKALVVTRVWQKWRFSAPQTHLWLIKVWYCQLPPLFVFTKIDKIVNFRQQTFTKPLRKTYKNTIAKQKTIENEKYSD
jgi:hypothetical protein